MPAKNQFFPLLKQAPRWLYQILNLDGANATVEEISSQGGTSFTIKTNVAVEQDILILIDTTAADYCKFYLFFEEEKRNYCQCSIYWRNEWCSC
ncbi:hypothetical protein D3C74_287760 [compost metagenome]